MVPSVARRRNDACELMTYWQRDVVSLFHGCTPLYNPLRDRENYFDKLTKSNLRLINILWYRSFPKPSCDNLSRIFSQMGRSKLKKKNKWMKNLQSEPTDSGIPIPNLPENFLLMRVKSGTKIRNVLGYALKEFENYNSVVWTAAGHGIGKAISCAELFKRKHEGLHQITKLRYVESEKSKAENESDANVDADIRHVPEIHILLAKEITDVSEPGYQAPGNNGEFLNNRGTKNGRKGKKHDTGNNVACIDAEEFAAMGLRTGQKRPKKEQQAEAPRKKSKKKGNGDR